MEMREVVDRLKKRDKAALSYLFDNYANSLNGIISRILPIEKLYEQVLHETFSTIWHEIDQYDESKTMLFTWMSQIARNAAIDVMRQEVAESFLKKNEISSDELNNKKDKSITGRIEKKILIENLDEKHRVIIDYIYLKGYTQLQTAEALQIPLETVKTRLRLAILELRRLSNDEKDLFLGAISLTLFVISCLCL